MKATTACDLIRGVSYRPEWLIEATRCADDHILLTFHIVVPQSDVAYAPTYKVMIIIRKEFVVNVGSVATPDKLYRLVFYFIQQIESHEAREFFSVDGDTYRKPFHPHTHDGRALWGAPKIDEAYDDA